MAQIAALDFTYEYGDGTEHNCIIMNTNFGSPRWGNQKLINLYQTKMGNNSVRVVNRHDIIPLIPPKWPWADLNYVHTPIYIHYVNSQTEGPLEYDICKQGERENDCDYDIFDSCLLDHTHYLRLHDDTCDRNLSYTCPTWEKYLDVDGDGIDELSTDDNDTTVGNAYNAAGRAWKSLCQDIFKCENDGDKQTDQSFMPSTSWLVMILVVINLFQM